MRDYVTDHAADVIHLSRSANGNEFILRQTVVPSSKEILLPLNIQTITAIDFTALEIIAVCAN